MRFTIPLLSHIRFHLCYCAQHLYRIRNINLSWIDDLCPSQLFCTELLSYTSSLSLSLSLLICWFWYCKILDLIHNGINLRKENPSLKISRTKNGEFQDLSFKKNPLHRNPSWTNKLWFYPNSTWEKNIGT